MLGQTNNSYVWLPDKKDKGPQHRGPPGQEWRGGLGLAAVFVETPEDGECFVNFVQQWINLDNFFERLIIIM